MKATILPNTHEQNTFYHAVQENVDWLKPLLSDILEHTEKTEATTAFVAAIDTMLIERKKYETQPMLGIYILWLKMLDSKIEPRTKEELCEEFLKEYIKRKKDKAQLDISMGARLCYLSPIVVAPILLYSPPQMLSDYYQKQQKYGEVSNKICDKNFEATLTFLVNNSKLFSKETLTIFLHKLMNTLKELAKNGYYYSAKPDYLWHEAIANWEKKSLIKLVAENFDQELQAEYEKFQEIVQKKLENPEGNLSLQSQLDSLVFEKLLVKHHYCPESLTPIVVRFTSEKDMHELAAIYTAHGLDKVTMLKKHLIKLAKATNTPKYYEFSSLFFSSCLEYLKREAKYLAPELAAFLSAEFYAKNSYPFTEIRKEMFDFWIDHNPEQISKIVQTILTLPKDQHDTPIEHFFFELSFSKMSTSFYDKLSTLLSVKLTPEQFIKVYSAAGENFQYKLLQAMLLDEGNALTRLKNLSEAYKADSCSALFLRNISKQLKSAHPKLSEKVEELKIFQGEEVKDDLATDLQLLAKILANATLTHDERRSEVRRLKNLNNALQDQKIDTCPIVIQMFKSVPQPHWPDLFVYFDAEIIHWSFPQDEEHLKFLFPNKRPAPRKNTWLEFKADWENVLYGTLVAILADFSKNELRDAVAHWALSYLDQAFTKSADFFPGLADNVLEKFFITHAPNSIKVFEALHNQFRDKYHAPTYFSEKGIYNKVASWLPEDSGARATFLANLLKFDNGFTLALQTPFVKNKFQIAIIASILIATRTEHIVNFIQKFSGDIARTLFKAIYQFEKNEVLTLMQKALSDLGKANFPIENYLQLLAMLLSLIRYAKMDIFKIIDTEDNKDFLLKNLIDAKPSVFQSAFFPHFKLIFNIVHHYQPDALPNLVAKQIEYLIQKDDLYVLCACIDDAQKVLGKPFALPEALEKSVIDYLTQKISQMRYISHSEIQVIARFVPNFDQLFLTWIAKETMLQNTLDSKQKEYLDSLVRVYGFSSINATCVKLNMVKCSEYLMENFSKFPDILQQIDKAIKLYHDCFEVYSHEIDRGTISVFNSHLKSFIREAAKKSNMIPIEVNIADICKKSEISPELAALLPSLRIKINKAEIMPQNVLSWATIWSKKTNSQPPSSNVLPAADSQPKPI